MRLAPLLQRVVNLRVKLLDAPREAVQLCALGSAMVIYLGGVLVGGFSQGSPIVRRRLSGLDEGGGFFTT